MFIISYFRKKEGHQPRTNIFILFAFAYILIFYHHGFSQELFSDFNQNGKQIKIISKISPATETTNFKYPVTSDSDVVAIYAVTEGLIQENDQTCTEQIVHLRMKSYGQATITIETDREQQFFEFMPQARMFAVGITDLLPTGSLPEGDFVALAAGDTFMVRINIINLDDESVADVNGMIMVTLDCDDPNPGFRFGNGMQAAPVKVGNGSAAIKLIVAGNASGQKCKLKVSDESLSVPQLIRTQQIYLGAAQVQKSTQLINRIDETILFPGSVQDKLAEMIFTHENLNSVTVTAFCGDGDADKPNLFVPPFPFNTTIPRFYSIAADPPDTSFNTSLTLYYSQAEFNKGGLADESKLQLYRFKNKNWEIVGGQANPDNNSVTVENIHAFSYWAFAEPSDPATFINKKSVPQSFFLYQNVPNPFNSKTAISYQLPAVSNVKFSIYNILGLKVATLISKKQAAGKYTVEWDANGFSSGIYLYTLATDQGFSRTKKLILLK